MNLQQRKKPRLNTEVTDEGKVETTVENGASLLILNDDCLETLFEWFPLNELASISKTCKRLHQMAAEFFQRKYSRVVINIWKYDRLLIIPNTPWSRTFSHLIRHAQISGDDIDIYRSLATRVQKELKSLCIHSRALSVEHTDCIKDTLQNVETIIIEECSLTNDLHGTVLQHCKSMKRLQIRESFIERDSQLRHFWLQQTYPLLEVFQMDNIWTVYYTHLVSFFQRNPTIKSFYSNETSPQMVARLIREVDVKLNDLLIGLNISFYSERSDKISKMEELHQNLNGLYENGNYKRLYLKFWRKSICIDFSEQLKSIQGIHGIDVKSIEIDSNDIATAIASFSQLSRLHLYTIRRVEYAEILSRELCNLEQMDLVIDTYDTVYPFIRNSPKLRSIYFIVIRTDDTIVDLAKLNRERAKLPGACKLTLYIDHHRRFPLKNAIEHLKYPLIEVKASESYIKPDYL